MSINNAVRHLTDFAHNTIALGAVADLLGLSLATLQCALLVAITALRLFAWWRSRR